MHELPIGCSLAVYVQDPSLRPKAIALRPNQKVDVTVSYILERTPVPLFLEDDSCTGEGTTVQYALQRFTLELGDLRVGDRLVIEGADTAPSETVHVVAASGFCPTPVAPLLACPDDTPERCDDEETGGCASSPAPSGAIALAFGIGLVGFGLLRRRPRC